MQNGIDGALLNSFNNVVGERAISDKFFDLVKDLFAEPSKCGLLHLEATKRRLLLSFHLWFGEDLLLERELPTDCLCVLVRNLQQLSGFPDCESELNLGYKQLNTNLLVDVFVFFVLALILLDHFLALSVDGAG